MAFRVIVDRRNPAEVTVLIEFRRLETVGRQNDLRAASSCRFILRGLQQASSGALPSTIFSDPDRLELAAPAPCMAVQAGVDFSVDGSKRDGQEPRIPNTGVLDVVLVEQIIKAALVVDRKRI